MAQIGQGTSGTGRIGRLAALGAALGLAAACEPTTGDVGSSCDVSTSAPTAGGYLSCEADTAGGLVSISLTDLDSCAGCYTTITLPSTEPGNYACDTAGVFVQVVDPAFAPADGNLLLAGDAGGEFVGSCLIVTDSFTSDGTGTGAWSGSIEADLVADDGSGVTGSFEASGGF